MESLPLFKNYKERIYFFILLFFIFIFNIYLHFLEYQNFNKDEIFQTNATIINIYPKKTFQVIKLQTKNSRNDFTFFTSANKDEIYQKLQVINLFIVTQKISFYEYLKGFYAKSFNITKLKSQENRKEQINKYISLQHKNSDISSFYSALFLAIPISQNIRDICSKLGISHLVAISGFHLGVMSLVLYFILHLIYNPIHQKFFPYRNKRFDLLLFITVILFSYLIFVDFIPSLLRAFVMFTFGLFLLRNNIKIFSFETLLVIVVIILAIFPKLLFSLSLWFSVTGVFYILLFLHYFRNLNKYIQFILFNFWIYFAINPVVHYFFGVTTLAQFYSPLLTILFTIFYPLVALLHLLKLGGVFDSFFNLLMNYQIHSIEILTPLWFFLLYIVISFLSIFSKRTFIVLNVLLVAFGVSLFIQL